MARPTRGLYMTKGRANEIERRINDVERDLSQRVAAAEARAAAAEATSARIFEALVKALHKPATTKAA